MKKRWLAAVVLIVAAIAIGLGVSAGAGAAPAAKAGGSGILKVGTVSYIDSFNPFNYIEAQAFDVSTPAGGDEDRLNIEQDARFATDFEAAIVLHGIDAVIGEHANAGGFVLVDIHAEPFARHNRQPRRGAHGIGQHELAVAIDIEMGGQLVGGHGIPLCRM